MQVLQSDNDMKKLFCPPLLLYLQRRIDSAQRVDGWERQQVGGGGADEPGDEWEQNPEGGVRRKKSAKTKRKQKNR